jgi:hypothetical protein
VSVYAGIDPLTGRRLYLSESTTDEAEAKRILNKFRARVDEQRNARTNGLFRMAIEEWLKVLTEHRERYENFVRKLDFEPREDAICSRTNRRETVPTIQAPLPIAMPACARSLVSTATCTHCATTPRRNC